MGRGDGADTFERWYRSYHSRLVAHCRRILGDAAAAEDVAQETLLRAWLGRDRMREEDVGAWLTVVARNLCISHLRRQKKQIPTEFLPETPDDAADPARLVERLESRRAVRHAMRGMGERHRKVLHLREIEGVDYEHLSAETGLSPAGTRTVLFRARRVLRDRLAAVGEGLAAFVAGVKIRFRSVIDRGRSAVETATGAATPAAPAALNLVLAFGITFAVVGGGGAFSASSAGKSAGAVFGSVAPAAAARPAPGASTGARDAEVEAARHRRASDDLGTPWLRRPNLYQPPSVVGRPYRCGEGDTLVTVDAAGQNLGIENWREEGELIQPVYDVEDVAFDAASDKAPSVCERLGQPIGVHP